MHFSHFKHKFIYIFLHLIQITEQQVYIHFYTQITCKLFKTDCYLQISCLHSFVQKLINIRLSLLTICTTMEKLTLMAIVNISTNNIREYSFAYVDLSTTSLSYTSDVTLVNYWLVNRRTTHANVLIL